MDPTVAVVGASANRSKFGNKAVRAFASRGYRVFPIHPRADTIEGWPAYRSVADVPLDNLDLVTIYLPSQIGLQILPEVAKKPVREVWLNPGADSLALVALGKQLGLNIVTGCSILAIGVNPHGIET